MGNIQVDVIALLPEKWGLCRSCETLLALAKPTSVSPGYPPDDYPPELQEELTNLIKVLTTLLERYSHSTSFSIFDPRSFQGLVKSIKYRVRKYPTFIVAGRTKITGLDVAQIEKALIAAGAIKVDGGE